MFIKIQYKLAQFSIILLASLIINLCLTLFWYYNATDDDFANLPKKKNGTTIFDDRFISLFYYNCSTYGTLGDAKIYPKSNRAKLFTGGYVLLMTAGLVTAADITT
jgi:hypothetical protein